MNLGELAEIVSGEIFGGEESAERKVSGVSDDSRRVKYGDVFFAMRGGKNDGRQFADEAVERGACALVTDERVSFCQGGRRITQIVVKNVRKALARAACAFYDYPSKKMKIVGVTGTNGKTSVTYMLSSIFEGAGKKTGVIGTTGCIYGNVKIAPELTTPDPIFLQKILYKMQKSGVEYVFMEVSAHAIYYDKTAGMNFAARVFTNFSQDHLDFFKSMTLYRETKESFFFDGEGKARDGVFIINADDECGRKIARNAENVEKARLIYGMENPSDVFAVITDESLDGSNFLLNVSDDLSAVTLPFIGRYNVYNALAAASCAAALGIGVKTIAKGLKNAVAPKGRLQRVRGVNGAEIFIDFAHTPDSLEKSIDALRPFCKRKLYVLFGCGGDRDRGKRAQMGAIAAKKADFAYLTSDNPRYEDAQDIIAEIEKGFRRFSNACATLTDRKKAIFYAVNFLKKGDVLLIAGKGGEETQEIMGIKYEYDDERVAEQAILAKIAGETE